MTMELGAKAMEAMNAMKLSKVEAAQVLLTSAVEFGYGTGTALAMVLGAKELCRAAAHKQRFKARKWEKRAEAAGREERRRDGMFVTPPFAMAAEDKVEEGRTETAGEDADVATNAVQPAVTLAAIRSAMVQGGDPMVGVDFK